MPISCKVVSTVSNELEYCILELNTTEPENVGVEGHSAHLLHDCVTPLGAASSMTMLTGMGGWGASGNFKPSMASVMGADGRSGAGSVLKVHPETAVSPEDRCSEISQTSPLAATITLPMRTSEFFGTERNLPVAVA